MPFDIPKGYEKITGIDRFDKPKTYALSVDLDNDNINDKIQLASNNSNNEKVLLFIE